MSKNTAKSTPQYAPIERTSVGLRDALFDALDALRNEDATPAQANSAAKIAASIIATVDLELKVQRHAVRFSGTPRTTEIGSPIPLGKT